MLVFAFCILLIGLSKGGLGGPLPVGLVVPALSLVMPPQVAVPLVLPFLIFADVFALRIYWRKWDMRLVRLLMPAAIVGILMGGVLLGQMDTDAETRGLKIFIGIVTLVAIAYKLASDHFERLAYEPKAWHGYIAGWVSSFTSTLVSNGGPPFTIYMLLQQRDPVTFIGTTTLFFAVINWLKIPIFVQQGLLQFDLVVGVLWAVPLIPLGVWLGRRALNFFNPQTFEQLMLALLGGAVVLLFATL